MSLAGEVVAVPALGLLQGRQQRPLLRPEVHGDRAGQQDRDELQTLCTNMSDYVGLNRIKIGLKSD